MRYIIADIHGCYEEYMELIQKIKLSEKDYLYILGDALDRGPEPMKVILDILKRQKVTYIIGNHDYLFLYFVRKLGLDLSKVENISAEDISDFQVYLEDGGLTTIEAFLKLSQEEKQAARQEEKNSETKELDALLLKEGYRRTGYSYRAEAPNHRTIVLVCHFGLSAVLLSHLLNCSPYSLWQHTVAAPTSVTTLYTEEREEGVAHFRCASFGDISHLYAAGEEPAFAARFCECFTDDTRHH